MQKNLKEIQKTWHFGTHLRVLSESYLMTTNMTGFSCFSKIFAFLFWRKVVSALEELYLHAIYIPMQFAKSSQSIVWNHDTFENILAINY